MARRNHRLRTPITPADKAPAARAVAPSPRLLPLGAIAAGFGLFGANALAQVAPPAAPASAPQSPGAKDGATLSTISVKARVETDQNSVRATTTTIGRGNQELRDVPQSVTVLTEKLLEDRRVDTVKQALHYTAGISFQAAEGGEEDIRLRGFSLAASGDIYVDSVRDPAFYERDVFNFDRIELLRGSASMLFGRGSTGGVVNQVSKLPILATVSEVSVTGGNAGYYRLTGDFNLKTSETSALRFNAVLNEADSHGNRIDRYGIAPTLRWGIGTADEFYISGYYLSNDNGINYGLPWLKQRQAQTGANPSSLITTIDPSRYYQAASDYNMSSAALTTASHTHRFSDGGVLHTIARHGRFDRDQRAGTVRFFTNSVATNGPIVVAPGQDTVSDATRLVENGPNNKVQNMFTTYVQSDYTNQYSLLGMKHDVLGGIDLAHEKFKAFGTVVPAGVTLNKNAIPFYLGSSNPNSVDESLRSKRVSGSFVAKAEGVYVQDLIQVLPDWKVLGGLRWDHFYGDYRTYQANDSTTVAIGTPLTDRSRTDSLLSKRAGLLWQPTESVTGYFSYGTSFNTSGDTYQYDDQTKNTPPESSENLELGVKADLFAGRLSTRLAIFRAYKFNERNRDTDSAATQALLSGKRHSEGVEVDLAGRITAGWEAFLSYAWIPIARVDVGAPGSVFGVGEGAGTRSALTPRHSGSLFTSYQLTPSWRLGGGVNMRSPQTPNRNPAGIVAPGFVTYDLIGEYAINESIAFKINILNLTNKLYADTLYTAHYIPGQPRTVYATVTARF